jgi:ABC-type transporter MlaC component
MMAPVTLQFLVKKLREQGSWKVEKITFSSVFLVLQLPKNYLRNEGER